MNFLELDFLFGLSFHLNVTPTTFHTYCSYLQREIFLDYPLNLGRSLKLHCCFSEDESTHQKHQLAVWGLMHLQVKLVIRDRDRDRDPLSSIFFLFFLFCFLLGLEDWTHDLVYKPTFSFFFFLGFWTSSVVYTDVNFFFTIWLTNSLISLINCLG